MPITRTLTLHKIKFYEDAFIMEIWYLKYGNPLNFFWYFVHTLRILRILKKSTHIILKKNYKANDIHLFNFGPGHGEQAEELPRVGHFFLNIFKYRNFNFMCNFI